ncbi:MAG: lytic transglycosylase domain-containing protein [Clostridia bacterium]|nr:lytic transglycosylase domain-containing protein [Clostridia bacterium]
MNKKTQIKRFIAVLLIACISIGVGVIVNEIWNFIDRKTHPLSYDEIITAASEEFDVPKYIIYATIKVESDFDPDAVSSKGAIGLMQMLPKTFEWLTGDEHLGEHLPKRALDTPEVSIRYGTYYLSYLYKKFDYNWNTAIAAYNGGEGNVAKLLKDPKYSDGEGNLTDFPEELDETKNYVKKVKNAIDTYRELYPDKLEGKSTQTEKETKQ